MSVNPRICQSDCALAAALKQLFAVEFEFEPHNPYDRQCCDNPACQTECGCRDGIFVSNTNAGHWDVVLRGVESTAGLHDARGCVHAVDRQSVIRMVRVALELADKEQTIGGLNEELSYVIEQLSDDLEEVCWFRRMAEEVAACRADQPLGTLSDQILPQLRNLLKAQTVLVLTEADSDRGQLPVAAVDSECDSDHEPCAQALVALYGSEAQNRAVVRNGGFSNAVSAQISLEANSFVLVRIGDQSRNFGWLVSIGKKDVLGSVRQRGRVEPEFGTHEATLMESAAVLLATHAANCELFAEQERTLVGVVGAMVNALDARDPYTRGHSHRVALIARRLAEEIGLGPEEMEDLYLTGLLHDIGKIGVADQVLLKDGPLTPEQRRQIELHTVIGHSILSPVPQLKNVLPGVLHHHERIDGTGYPDRLAGDQIPLAGRILAVADAFDAMTTSRPYRKAMPVVEAVQILLEGVCTHWDEVVVDAFFKCLADIRQIYEDDSVNHGSRTQSILQYGRFEDISHGRVADLAKLSGAEI